MQTCSDLSQLIDFCQKMLTHKAMHPDIKLTNFLLNSKGQVIISDQKAIMEVQADGLIQNRGLVSTKAFSPPEHLSQGGTARLNPEKFMSYQLGLAMYDELVLPIITPGEKAWHQEKPLNFNHPIFLTETGKIMKGLIEGMTQSDPAKRTGLTDAKIIIDKVRDLVNQNKLKDMLSSYKTQLHGINDSKTTDTSPHQTPRLT